MKLCEWCHGQYGKPQGAHTVCELCWKRHILSKQDGCCHRCGNDPESLDEYKWSEYNVNDASIGELVCKQCHRKMARRKQLLVNRRVNPDLVTGASYYDKLIKCGVDGETAGRIYRELEEKASAFVIDRARTVYSGLGTQEQIHANIRGRSYNFKRRELCRILLREDMRGVAAQLNLLPKPKDKKASDVGRSVNVSTLPLDMRGALKIEGPPVMTEGDCKLLGLPVPPKKKRYEKKEAATMGECGFCRKESTLGANGLCGDCAELVM